MGAHKQKPFLFRGGVGVVAMLQHRALSASSELSSTTPCPSSEEEGR
ncbi:hypothetical protein M2341_000554 [Sphingobium sp. B7D2B]|nr:hypothetical protein [Sphingobium sp. B12D2B]MCW2365107.1 hypothetical protein [Sphingobium sp. B7D2B]MCW2413340.1 hypothetical protein [Sphingobium sp. B8D3D]MCW2414361.1 hypothetical protein [Sphingobium sp. B8D3A]